MATWFIHRSFKMIIQQPPLGLYVHMPWCIKKCPYCDFNSHPLKTELQVDNYIAALIADLTADQHKIYGRKIDSIFFGGGTPSLFPPASIARLLQGMRQIVDFADTIEITMEANPGALERQYLADYQAAGINRLSIGAQSFQDDKLQTLGRIHSSKDIIATLEQLQALGWKNFNIDLMFGLPKQSVADALADLTLALSFNPTHISWYQLTLEPNTAFYNKPPQLPNGEICWQIQQAGNKLLSDSNFKQYEVSAFARSVARRCQHNLNYWLFGDYLGIGAGAHSKITNFQQVRMAAGDQYGSVAANDHPGGAMSGTWQIERFWKHKHPKAYMAAVDKSIAAQTIAVGNGASPQLAKVGNGALQKSAAVDDRAQVSAFIAEHTVLNKEQLPFEFMLNALRLTDGVAKNLFIARTGLSLAAVNAIVNQATAEGLMQPDPLVFKTTELGKRFLDDLLQMFLK